jgi:hypothetical protein
LCHNVVYISNKLSSVEIIHLSVNGGEFFLKERKKEWIKNIHLFIAEMLRRPKRGRLIDMRVTGSLLSPAVTAWAGTVAHSAMPHSAVTHKTSSGVGINLSHFNHMINPFLIQLGLKFGYVTL